MGMLSKKSRPKASQPERPAAKQVAQDVWPQPQPDVKPEPKPKQLAQETQFSAHRPLGPRFPSQQQINPAQRQNGARAAPRSIPLDHYMRDDDPYGSASAWSDDGPLRAPPHTLDPRSQPAMPDSPQHNQQLPYLLPQNGKAAKVLGFQSPHNSRPTTPFNNPRDRRHLAQSEVDLLPPPPNMHKKTDSIVSQDSPRIGQLASEGNFRPRMSFAEELALDPGVSGYLLGEQESVRDQSGGNTGQNRQSTRNEPFRRENSANDLRPQSGREYHANDIRPQFGREHSAHDIRPRFDREHSANDLRPQFDREHSANDLRPGQWMAHPSIQSQQPTPPPDASQRTQIHRPVPSYSMPIATHHNALPEPEPPYRQSMAVRQSTASPSRQADMDMHQKYMRPPRSSIPLHLQHEAASLRSATTSPAESMHHTSHWLGPFGPSLAILDGLKVNKSGKILNEEGEPIGELVEGDIMDCVRQKANSSGQVLDEYGRIVGMVRTVSRYGPPDSSEPHSLTRQRSEPEELRLKYRAYPGVPPVPPIPSGFHPTAFGAVQSRTPIVELDASEPVQPAPTFDLAPAFDLSEPFMPPPHVPAKSERRPLSPILAAQADPIAPPAQTVDAPAAAPIAALPNGHADAPTVPDSAATAPVVALSNERSIAPTAPGNALSNGHLDAPAAPDYATNAPANGPAARSPNLYHAVPVDAPAAPLEDDAGETYDPYALGPVSASEVEPVRSLPEEFPHAMQREPVNAMQREPVNAIQREPVNSMQREPVNATQREPVNFMQREPVNATQREPVKSMQREPVNSMQREPVNSMQREPVNPMQKEPLNATQREQIDPPADPLGSLSNDYFNIPSTAPVTTPSTAPLSTPSAKPINTHSAAPLAPLNALPRGPVSGPQRELPGGPTGATSSQVREALNVPSNEPINKPRPTKGIDVPAAARRPISEGLQEAVPVHRSQQEPSIAALETAPPAASLQSNARPNGMHPEQTFDFRQGEPSVHDPQEDRSRQARPVDLALLRPLKEPISNATQAAPSVKSPQPEPPANGRLKVPSLGFGRKHRTSNGPRTDPSIKGAQAESTLNGRPKQPAANGILKTTARHSAPVESTSERPVQATIQAQRPMPSNVAEAHAAATNRRNPGNAAGLREPDGSQIPETPTPNAIPGAWPVGSKASKPMSLANGSTADLPSTEQGQVAQQAQAQPVAGSANGTAQGAQSGRAAESDETIDQDEDELMPLEQQRLGRQGRPLARRASDNNSFNGRFALTPRAIPSRSPSAPSFSRSSSSGSLPPSPFAAAAANAMNSAVGLPPNRTNGANLAPPLASPFGAPQANQRPDLQRARSSLRNAPHVPSPLGSHENTPHDSDTGSENARSRSGSQSTMGRSASGAAGGKPRTLFTHQGRVTVDPGSPPPTALSDATWDSQQRPAEPEKDSKQQKKKGRFSFLMGKKGQAVAAH